MGVEHDLCSLEDFVLWQTRRSLHSLRNASSTCKEVHAEPRQLDVVDHRVRKPEYFNRSSRVQPTAQIQGISALLQ
jgi:hypothetical protein